MFPSAPSTANSRSVTRLSVCSVGAWKSSGFCFPFLSHSASVAYCLLLAKVVIHFDSVSRWFWRASIVVLLAFAGELLLLATLRAVRSLLRSVTL